jgi:exopolyphosphatase/guanosine-5'-triphosphate,3'-diphosphate pyrophosphatase
MPTAILDFGTNTFNLLIAEKDDKGFKVLYNGKQGVKLGKGGINKRTISPDAMERGFTAISNHIKTIEEYGVSEIHAYATSAMRNADNGLEFAAQIEDKFGFKTNIIDGEEEAALIYEGISASINLDLEPAMILDIGGGSNEFIICNSEGILWKHSFELGMARIIEKFQLSEPIKKEEIDLLENYYNSELNLLWEQLKIFNPRTLIGASGSFDTLAEMARLRFEIKTPNDVSSVEIDMDHYNEIHTLLLNSTREERLLMPGMEPVRVEMIVPAAIFINFVYNRCGLTAMKQSGYALKEGVMSRLTNY